MTDDEIEFQNRLVVEVLTALLTHRVPGGRRTRMLDHVVWGLTARGPTTTTGLARALGIPRQTVQARVRMLIEAGWLTRDEQGFLHAVRTGIPEEAERFFLQSASPWLRAVIRAGAIGKDGLE